MEQVAQYIAGERDYTKIKGGTGPLVYPAAHVYIYTALYYITDEGRNILLAQQLFALLYQVTLMIVMACYWQAKVRWSSKLEHDERCHHQVSDILPSYVCRPRRTSSRS